MTQPGANARNFVRGNRRSYPAAAYEDASIGLALNEGLSHGFCVIGIIDRVRTVGANI